MDLVVPNVFVGDRQAAENLNNLQGNKITHIVVAASELNASFPDKFIYLFCDLRDDLEEALYPHALRVNKFIDTALASGGRVLLHCHMGRSRSIALMAMYMHHQTNISAHDALSIILKKRKLTMGPNKSFIAQLDCFT